MTHPRMRRPAAVALVAALAAVSLAACGSSSTTRSTRAAAASGSGTSASARAARSKLVACLKAHGVTLPSRPPGTRRPPAPGRNRGGGFFFGGGGGGPRGGHFAANPKLRAAVQACGGARGVPGRRRIQFSHATVQKFVTCVRQHGYTLPAPNFSGKGPVFPAKIAKDAKFQKAARSCASLLRPSGAPRAAPGAPGPGMATAGA